MAVAKEILSDYKEVYEKALSLVNEESRNDPPNEPYRSHYAAKELLLEMEKNLKNDLASILADESDDEKEQKTYKMLLAFVLRDLGRIYSFTEEPSVGKEFLRGCIELTLPYKTDPAAVIPLIGALCELGIVVANAEDFKTALDVLKQSEEIYNDFKATGKAAMAISDLFGTPEEIEEGKGNEELEKLYIICAFYLAQVYGHLNELEKSATYCYNTLRRQMDSKSYESIDFAMNIATLSQYFITRKMFKVARHHLAVGTWVMAEHEAKMITPEMSEAAIDDVKETFKHRYADLARCWAKYGLALLSASKKRLLNYDDDDDEEEKLLVEDLKKLDMGKDNFRFPDLQVEVYENRVSADFCLVLDDAKLIFQFVVKWLDEAKAYYKLDTEASEYAKIINDYAELYEHMAFFEENPVNQAKMQKRRAKYLEELLNALNPTYYLSICRECWYGAGLAYCAILDILLDQENPSPTLLEKINQVCEKAIKHFMEFGKSYMENDSVMKPNLSTEEIRTVLLSYFHMGRLYYKMVTPCSTKQHENMSNSLMYYKRFTDECDKYPEAAKILTAEIGVTKELVTLLPIKIANIQKRIP